MGWWWKTGGGNKFVSYNQCCETCYVSRKGKFLGREFDEKDNLVKI